MQMHNTHCNLIELLKEGGPALWQSACEFIEGVGFTHTQRNVNTASLNFHRTLDFPCTLARAATYIEAALWAQDNSWDYFAR